MSTIEELEAALDWFNSHYAPSECKHYKPISKALQQAIEIKRGEKVVVPREPTYQMSNAGKWAAFEHAGDDEELQEYAADNDECALIYKAMITAAQEDR
jgi:hypothetical protein